MLTIDEVITQLSAELATSKWSITAFKQALADCDALLAKRFYADEDIVGLVHDRVHFMDKLLGLAWQ